MTSGFDSVRRVAATPEQQLVSEGARVATGAGEDAGAAVQASEERSKLGLFVRASLPDFCLCLAVSAALACTVLNAFTVDSAFAADVAMSCAVMIPVLVMLFAGGWSRGARLGFSIAICLAAVVFAGIGASMTPTGSPLEESEFNRFIPMVTWVVVPVIVYVLSRRVWGLPALLLLSLVACGVVEYLYEGSLLGQFVVVAFGLIALFVFQTYRQSLLAVSHAKDTNFAAAALSACAVAGVSIGVGAAVFFGIIAPLNPPAAELKLFQEEYALETVEFSGMYQDPSDEDPDNKTNETDERDNDTNEDKSDQQGKTPEDMPKNPLDGLGSALSDVVSAFSMEEEPEDYQGISYQILRVSSLAFLALLVVAVVAAVLLKRHGRKRRLDKLEGKTNGEKVMELFDFLESRLARMGFKRPENLTAGEYAVASYRGMKAFSRDTGAGAAVASGAGSGNGNTGEVSFLNVTQAFYRARYGGLDVSDDDYAGVERFYRAFFKNARRYVGWPKWLAYKFWRI